MSCIFKFLSDLLYDSTISTETSEIGKLLFSFLSRLLDYYYYKGPLPLIFTCIGFNFIRTLKEKQKGVLQV